MKRKLVLFAALLLAACSIGPRPSPSATVYDLGLAEATSQRLAPFDFDVRILLTDVSAPDWLDTRELRYRLAYLNANAAHAYADSRWAAPPADLLTQRLRQRLIAAGATPVTSQDSSSAGFTLRVQLDEFAQIFEAENKSHALVRLHATLIKQSERGSIAQRTFVVEQPAKSADAEGAALALAAASDTAIAQLLDWLAHRLAEGNKALAGPSRDDPVPGIGDQALFRASVTPSPMGTSESSTR